MQVALSGCVDAAAMESGVCARGAAVVTPRMKVRDSNCIGKAGVLDSDCRFWSSKMKNAYTQNLVQVTW